MKQSYENNHIFKSCGIQAIKIAALIFYFIHFFEFLPILKFEDSQSTFELLQVLLKQ